MDDRFTSLATLLRAAPQPATTPSPPVCAPPQVAALERHAVSGSVDFAHADLVAELALMKLAALEAFEGASRRLLRLLASDVLARELLLAPVELDTLARAVLAELSQAQPVALVVSPADAERVRSPLPVRVDASLGAGDLVVEVRDGTIESSFTFRCEAAIECAEGGA